MRKKIVRCKEGMYVDKVVVFAKAINGKGESLPILEKSVGRRLAIGDTMALTFNLELRGE